MCQTGRACLAPGSECSFKGGKGEKDKRGISEEEEEETEKRGGKGEGQKCETQP